MQSANLCISCKGGRNLCGNYPCPLLAKFKVEPKINQSIDKDFFGPATSVFVGHNGYPTVNIGPLAAIELKDDIENPSAWYGKDYNEIIELRSLLLRSKVSHHIKSKDNFIMENRELALAKRPTDVEMNFIKRPVYKVSFSDIHQPMGPTAQLEKMKLTENPHISRNVEYIVTDDLKAADASLKLYNENLDVYKITTILSSGALGFEKNQKLVPTRWSITAVDDIITKNLLQDIRKYPSVNDFQVYSGQFLDNHFEILLMPGNWEYEGFEAWSPQSVWAQGAKQASVVEEYEPFEGRKSYADKQGGGYYAARIAVVEHLHKIKRQARVVVFREIYEGYNIPLGVWVVRENARKAMLNQTGKFASMDADLNFIKSRLKYPLENYKQQSILLRQKRLVDWF